MFRGLISRRGFIKVLVAGLASIAGGGLSSRRVFAQPKAPNGRKNGGLKGAHDLVVAKGDDPYKMTIEAVKAMGGLGRFVKKGSTVVVKPNIAWDKSEEFAANTNPKVVSAVVELCYQAGASRVNVFDRTCNSAERCYANSGIKEAALAKGAKVYFVDDWNYVKAHFDYKSPMEGWPIYRDAIECDTFINIPILKHHSLANLTISMKNLMGVCGGNRGEIHQNMGRKLVDLTDFISPDLTIIDAYRVLIAHGPSGGDLNDVVKKSKLIIATDPTLADTYASRLVDYDPMSIPNIAEAAKRKFGSTDLEGRDIFELTV